MIPGFRCAPAAAGPSVAQGWPIRGPRLVHIPEHEEDYCLDCIEAMTEFNEEAEVL